MKNATTSTRDLVEVTRHIAAATTALTHLATTLNARSTGTPQNGTTHPRLAKVRAAQPKRAAKKGVPGAGRIPASVMKKINHIQHKKANPPLSEDSKRAIRSLLLAKTIPVSVIATLYKRTPAYIYALNKAWGLKVHQASPALMQGIRRMKSKAKRHAAPKVETPAPTPAPAAPAPIAQTPVPEAAPQAIRPIAVEV